MPAVQGLPKYQACFICGDDNASGTNLTWRRTADGVEGSYVAAPRHCGFEGVIHGGIISGLLDECVGWAVALDIRHLCVTGELQVRFVAPVRVGETVSIRGRSAEQQDPTKPYSVGTGEVVNGEGKVLATCTGKFFPMPEAMQNAVLGKLEFPDSNDLCERSGPALQDVLGMNQSYRPGGADATNAGSRTGGV